MQLSLTLEGMKNMILQELKKHLTLAGSGSLPEEGAL